MADFASITLLLKPQNSNRRFEILTVALLRIQAFWDVTLDSCVSV